MIMQPCVAHDQYAQEQFTGHCRISHHTQGSWDDCRVPRTLKLANLVEAEMNEFP